MRLMVPSFILTIIEFTLQVNFYAILITVYELKITGYKIHAVYVYQWHIRGRIFLSNLKLIIVDCIV